ncbi:MAG TPA: hypothetical protein VFB08_09400 [Burkholderiales bacterium]|nr:hypothetical protein [Burkholderiales bacterium]
MKRSLIALAVVLTTASYAGMEGNDRSLPAYPEIGAREAATLLAGANGYRFDAGQPTQDLVVQDYGSV